jgi:IS5 family transposase
MKNRKNQGQDMNQLTFADIAIADKRKESRVSLKLEKINKIVNWQEILEIVKVVDYTDKHIGGAPHKDILVKVKMLFLQYLYNLSNPELEDQVNDRLSFQKFVGIGFNTTVPAFTTIWRFKERLIEKGLNDKLFSTILKSLEEKSLLLKKGSIVDATIIESSNKPLSNKKRKKLEDAPSTQIDTDAHSTKKRGKFYFGYKGHIATDVGSKLIRKRNFSSANPHDSQFTDSLLSCDEKAIFGDSAYGNKKDKQECRKKGVFYGILDKATKSKPLSNSQKKRNKKKSKIRSAVEHPFGYMKTKLNYTKAVAKNEKRNRFAFDMNCIIYNIFRANYLLERTA